MPSGIAKVRDVVAVKRGWGSDTVLFACGHVNSLNPIRSRKDKPYPPRRKCARCGNQRPIPVDLVAFTGGRTPPDIVVVNAKAALL